MPAMQATISMIPWITLKNIPVTAASSAFSCSFAPRQNAILAFIAMPNPTAIAVIRFCRGYTSEIAVMASSLIFATK